MAHLELAALMTPFAFPVRGFLVGAVACGAWLLFCRWICRDGDRRRSAELKGFESSAAALADLSARLATLSLARQHVGGGSPSDRLFLFGLALAGVVGVAFIAFRLAMAPWL